MIKLVSSCVCGGSSRIYAAGSESGAAGPGVCAPCSVGKYQTGVLRPTDRQTTSFIDNSIEAGILLSGNDRRTQDWHWQIRTSNLLRFSGGIGIFIFIF